MVSAELDLEIAEEWFAVDQEAWQRLEQEEQSPARGTPGAMNFTSPRPAPSVKD
jgi:hypothetical protein